MNEKSVEAVPPAAVLQQAEVMAQQIQLVVPIEVNFLPQQNNLVAPVAPQEFLAADLGKNVVVQQAPVDVIMEYQPEEDMFLNQQDNVA
jgi:hypothetical protein